jgi:hypothetical protein
MIGGAGGANPRLRGESDGALQTPAPLQESDRPGHVPGAGRPQFQPVPHVHAWQ